MLKQKQLQMEFKLEGTPYSPVANIGTGAYGVVCSALDTRYAGAEWATDGDEAIDED